MDSFIELFDENDLQELNLAPHRGEIRKIAEAVFLKSRTFKPRPLNSNEKMYLAPEASKELVRMMLKD